MLSISVFNFSKRSLQSGKIINNLNRQYNLPKTDQLQSNIIGALSMSLPMGLDFFAGVFCPSATLLLDHSDIVFSTINTNNDTNKLLIAFSIPLS